VQDDERFAARSVVVGISFDGRRMEYECVRREVRELVLAWLDEERLGEERVLELIRENRDNDTKVIVDRVFKMLEVHTRAVPIRDDLTLVVVRS
jgi:hypothetical protein